MKIAVDLRSSLHLIAAVIKWMSLAFILPIVTALIYGESILPFIIPLFVAFVVGATLEWLTKESKEITLREGFLVVSVVWLIAAAFGSLPYIIEGIFSPVDAYFESMSGFTATGSTVLTDIKAQSRSILLWRQFTQWLGGMGIIILAIAILPKLAVGGRQLMEAELPGPQVEKLTPRIRETAKALWKIYIGLTLAEVILLVVVGLSFYDALAHAFTTPATGGFSTKARNIEALGSAAQWVIIPFMFLGGVNFALLYRALRQPKAFLKDSEFKFYLGLVLLASGLVLLNLRGYEIGDAIRHSIFQVISILATGYSSTNFEEWNTTAKTIMLVLMFFGASAGSTSGSIKLIRVLLIFKIIAQQVRKAIHPQAVIPLRVGERVVSEDIVKGIVVFAIFYVMVSAGGVVVLLLDVGRVGIELSTLEAASAVATTLGNIGPGFGLVGPMSSFAPLPQTSKVLLTFLMWLGRLEIFPIIALFTRSYWKG